MGGGSIAQGKGFEAGWAACARQFAITKLFFPETQKPFCCVKTASPSAKGGCRRIRDCQRKKGGALTHGMGGAKAESQSGARSHRRKGGGVTSVEASKGGGKNSKTCRPGVSYRFCRTSTAFHRAPVQRKTGRSWAWPNSTNPGRSSSRCREDRGEHWELELQKGGKSGYKKLSKSEGLRCGDLVFYNRMGGGAQAWGAEGKKTPLKKIATDPRHEVVFDTRLILNGAPGGPDSFKDAGGGGGKSGREKQPKTASQ